MWKKKIATREMGAYLLVGGITTLINIACYYFFYNKLYISNLLSNALAWFFAVLFAFFANDSFVFTNQNKKNRRFFRGVQFFGARGASLLIDEFGMFLFVDVFYMYSLVSKVIMNVIVIIINYVLSKRIIFRTEEETSGN